MASTSHVQNVHAMRFYMQNFVPVVLQLQYFCMGESSSLHKESTKHSSQTSLEPEYTEELIAYDFLQTQLVTPQCLQVPSQSWGITLLSSSRNLRFESFEPTTSCCSDVELAHEREH